MWSPESLFPKRGNAAGVTGPTRGQNGEELDPKGVLQLAAQWAASITGAHGAAIAVGDASGMSCCSSFGNAPAVGAPVSSTSGLSGICLRTSEIVQCDDTETDPRVDTVASRKLDLRSVLIVPVLVDSRLRALIEVFSSKPHAFGARHTQDLTRMAESLAAVVAEPGSSPATDADSTPEQTAPAPRDEVVAKPAEIPAFALPHNFAAPKAAPVMSTSGTAAAAEPRLAPTAAQPRITPVPVAEPVRPVAPASITWRSLSPAAKAAVAGVCLVVLLAIAWFLVGRDQTAAPVAANGKASMSGNSAQAPAAPEITFSQSAFSVTTPAEGALAQGAGQSSQLTPGKLIRRVEPIYPSSARDSGIGGSVVLTATVSKTGAMENVKYVRGPEALADAATAAVRQWVYEPYRQNGEPVAVQTTIVVKFTPLKQQ